MIETEKKALALVNEVRDERGFRLNVEMQREDMAQEALCRAIEQHEAFRQEVSDALEKRGFYIDDHDLGRFIIPKPDPLVEAYNEALPETAAVHGKETVQHICAKISAALAARGLEVRKIGEGE